MSPMLAKTFGMVLFQTALSRNNELMRTNRLFHFFAVANYKKETYDMFLSYSWRPQKNETTDLSSSIHYFVTMLSEITPFQMSLQA